MSSGEHPCAYVMLALPMAMLNFAVARYYGAFLFLGAYATLVVIRVGHGIAVHWAHRARRLSVSRASS
jgi:hypothetical protein